jgi:hypothetical protein
MRREALLSSNKKFRYMLGRSWDDSLDRILFILLNPSVADSKKDDPTIKRLISFSKKWKYGGFWVCNLYAYITSYPKELYNNIDNNRTRKNKEYVKKYILKSKRIVYGWGVTEHEPEWLVDLVKKPYCFGKNKNGTPKHPLYLSSNTVMIKYKKALIKR